MSKKVVKKARRKRPAAPRTVAEAAATRGTKAVRRSLAALQLRKVRQLSWLAFAAVAFVLVAGGAALMATLPTSRNEPTAGRLPVGLSTQYTALEHSISAFQQRESKLNEQLVSAHDLQNMLSRVQIDAASGNSRSAKSDIVSAQTMIANLNLELTGSDSSIGPTPTPKPTPMFAGNDGDGASAPASTFLPILIYHYPPPDLEAQLDYLEAQHYTVITMKTAVAGLAGGRLPAKPVVLTFDDGFANQMQAFTLLQAHHMPATFYIINGGSQSLWCIGAGRRYNDPLQPAGGCGDAYLSWDQVRELDRSGLITIGGHTLDHPNLPTLTPAEQWTEIEDSKQEIEQEIGHSIHDFAYPYGAYNNTTIGLVKAAGYDDAVTTNAGTYQSPDSPYTLNRIRDTRQLP